MADQIELMKAELGAAKARAAEAYQNARPEMAAIQADEARDEIDQSVLEAAIWSYDLESVIRGCSTHMERGVGPTEEWCAIFQGTYRFYKENSYSETHERMRQTWPRIEVFTNSVRQLETSMQKVLTFFAGSFKGA